MWRQQKGNNMKYRAIYKCRLCGEQYEDGETGNDIAMMAVSVVTVKGSWFPKDSAIGIHLRNIHYCEDGSYGLSDFQGMKKED